MAHVALCPPEAGPETEPSFVLGKSLNGVPRWAASELLVRQLGKAV
jgi:hypothetical protein